MSAENKDRPFTFELSFDDSLHLDDRFKEGLEAEEEFEAPTFSEDELTAARDDGFRNGKQSGMQEALGGIEQQVANTLDGIGSALNGIAERQERAHQQLAKDASEVAISVVQKLMPAMVERHGVEEVETQVGEALRNLLEEPRITVWAAESVVSQLEQRLEMLATGIGFDGRIAVMPDTTMGPADCRIVWGDGEAERNTAETLKEANAAVDAMPGGDDPAEPLTPASEPSSETSETAPDAEKIAEPETAAQPEPVQEPDQDSEPVAEPVEEPEAAEAAEAATGEVEMPADDAVSPDATAEDTEVQAAEALTAEIVEAEVVEAEVGEETAPAAEPPAGEEPVVDPMPETDQAVADSPDTPVTESIEQTGVTDAEEPVQS